MQAVVLSVTDLNRQARRVLESEFPVVWVAGEISNFTRAASGHVYFTLKDEGAQVRCVMFRNRAQLVGWQLANGQQIEAYVRVTLYEARGDFQLGVEGMRQAGLGRLHEAFARLKEQLAAEGLFANERKRALPRLPEAIGVISSPQAAGLRDVFAALQRRAPHVGIVLYPTPVQGEAAAPGIVAAIAAANSDRRVDVLLLVRGGGSIEDLWAFNEVAVARAIAGSTIPVTSGIGHETDLSIADFVADQRAATPTAAAELVTAHWVGARHELRTQARHLQRALQRRLDVARQRVDTLELRLIHPATRIARLRDRLALARQRLFQCAQSMRQWRQRNLELLHARLERARPRVEPARARVDSLKLELSSAVRHHFATQAHRLGLARQSLQILNPDETVSRGYAIVRNSRGGLIRTTTQTEIGDRVRVQLADGQLSAQVVDKKQDGGSL